MSTIDEIKRKIDIIDIIGQSVKLTKAGRTLKGLCPFHTEKHGSFFIYPEQQTWHCFGACSTGGDVFTFVMKQNNMEFGEALKYLADKAGIDISQQTNYTKRKEKNEKLYSINSAAAKYYKIKLEKSDIAHTAREYLLKRGIDTKSIESFELGYSPPDWHGLVNFLKHNGYSEEEMSAAGLLIRRDKGVCHDRFHNMIIFPIFDLRGRIVGFGGRVLDDSLPKYQNTNETILFKKSDLLYGLHLAIPSIRKEDQTIIVEGYFDVITAHQNGFSNVVASMGTAVTRSQLESLKKYSQNIILALDADTAGEAATLRVIDYENILGREIRVLMMPPGQDPDSIINNDPKYWLSLISTATPLLDFVIDRNVESYDLTTAQGKSKIVEQVIPIIGRIGDPIRQSHYLQKLAFLVGVDQRRLESTIASQRVRPSVSSQTKIRSNIKPVRGSSLEDYCLCLLLRNPELKYDITELKVEHFSNTENRQLFKAYLSNETIEGLRTSLDQHLWPYLDNLLSQPSPEDHHRERLSDCVLRLQLYYLKKLQHQIEAGLDAEKESNNNERIVELQKQAVEIAANINEFDKRRDKQRYFVRKI